MVGAGAAIESDIVEGTSVAIVPVPFDAPWLWLAAGWRDLWRRPDISLGYGLVFATIAVLLTILLAIADMQALVLPLAGGFILVAPLAAVGLYEMSRRFENGRSVSWGDVLTAWRTAPGQLSFFGGILAFALFVWLQLALLLFMLFWGNNSIPPPSAFVPTLLFSGHGLGLLVTGTIVGGILAAIVFSISVISVPLLLTERLDAVTAARTSLMAIVRNPRPLALWAALIAAFMAVGIATLAVGLVIAFPLVGHATWHAYRDLVHHA
ncbi:MAG: DUF2189 domain-containing protein [Hyphomicrobiaceae bacterium]|nr:DUF2189 domain-containing protein [Hyphomicrobiaceae bacterium]